MAFNEVSLVAIVAGGILVLLALRLILKRHMLREFLAFAVALVMLTLGSLTLLAGFDLIGYSKLLEEAPVATVRFDRVGERRYRATLVDGNGEAHQSILAGDQWQLDVRIIRWHDRIAGLGVKPQYRLDRLSGRYSSSRDEVNGPRSVYDFNDSRYGIDTWQLARKVPALKALVDTQYGSGTFLPMVDAGIFRVTINSAGLVARPDNDRARQAVSDW